MTYKLGDIVTIGDCTLYCGDCLDILPTLGTVSVVVTDPPYGMNFQSNWCKDGPRFDRLIGDMAAPVAWLSVAPDADAIVVFCEWRNAEVFRAAIEAAGWPVRSQLVWDRVIHGMGDLTASFAPCHDLAWWACRPTYKFPGKRPTTVMRYQRVDHDKMVHPTEKPVELLAHIVSRATPQDGIVLDPFMGSGTTGVACVRLGRHFIGIELEPRYFGVAVKRIQDEYDRTALLESPPTRNVESLLPGMEPTA